jgi:hypothetical protein
MIKNGRLSNFLFKNCFKLKLIHNIFPRKSIMSRCENNSPKYYSSKKNNANLYSHSSNKNFSHKNTLLEEYQVIISLITDFSKF